MIAQSVTSVQSVYTSLGNIGQRHAVGPVVFPFCLIPGRIGRDRRFGLPVRLLVAFQQDYGATFTEWTPPLYTVQLAAAFQVSPQTMRRTLQTLRAGGYIQRHTVSRPKGGTGLFQYRIVPSMRREGE